MRIIIAPIDFYLGDAFVCENDTFRPATFNDLYKDCWTAMNSGKKGDKLKLINNDEKFNIEE